MTRHIDPSRPDNRDKDDFLASLEDRRRELVERLRAYKKGTGITGAAALLGGAAIVADITLFGGIGTAIAIGGGAGWIGLKRKTRKIERELKEVDDRLYRLHEIKFSAEVQNPALKGKNLTDNFTPAAKAEIEALREKLTDLEKQMDAVQKPKPDGKPPFQL